jgi:alpha-amylase
MSNPWNGKVVLEVFFWNCSNSAYSSWYDYLAKLAPRLAAMGFDGIWTPPPCKDSAPFEPMGYTPYDYYDIGQKNQIDGVSTGFGPQDDFLRMIAVAHANGLEVYPDIVLDHCGTGGPDPASPFTGINSRFQTAGFAETGRWQRNWLDFHYNPVHWHPTGDWTPSIGNDFGCDFCYQGRCSDSGNADSNCAARQNARAWLVWFVQQTGVDGFRFDDVKGFPPEVVEDVLYNAMGDRIDYFCAGEYIPDASADLDNWANATLNRCGTFDYSFRWALSDLVFTNGFFNTGNLPSLQQQNRVKTVPFVNNHDNYDGEIPFYIDPDNPRTQLAYAIAITVDGSPQLFYADLFQNFAPWNTTADANKIPTRLWMENLVWCHQKLAFKSGDYFVRYQDSEQLLILERGNRAIVAINNDGSAWHSAWISTAFPPNTQLHDYSGSRPDDIWTNQDAWVEIAVPPLSYSIWGPAGISGGFSPAPLRTLQQFEMDDDLGDSNPDSPGYGGKIIPGTYRTAGAIWPAPGSEVNIFVYSDTAQQVDFQACIPGAVPAVMDSGPTGPTDPLIVHFTVGKEGRYLLQARLSTAGAAPARIYVKADYIGPATSSAF